MDAYIRDFDPEEYHTKRLPSFELINKALHSDQIKIFHLNIRSISKNLDQLILFLEQIVHDFEVIILTETFVLEDPQIYQITGYKSAYNNGNLNTHDGVLVFVKESIESLFEVVTLGEINVLEVEFLYASTKVKLTCIYRSPSTSAAVFNGNLNAYLSSKKGCDCDYHILGGDINIDLLSQNNDTNEYKNTMSTYGYDSYINIYTRPQSKTCLDHFFLTSEHASKTIFESNINGYVIDYDITDHQPTILTIEVKQAPKVSKQHARNYMNLGKLKSDLMLEEWGDICTENNSNTLVERFISKFSYYIRKNTNVVIKNNKSIPKHPWITKALLKSINEKNCRYKLTKENPENSILKQQYTSYKNKLLKLIEHSKRIYIQKTIDESTNEPKIIWQHVNKIFNKTRPKPNITKIEDEHNEMLDDQKEIAEAFNKFFTNLGSVYASKIKKPKDFIEDKFSVRESFFLVPTNAQEIKDVIIELKDKRSPGIDNIKAETIKYVKDEIADIVAYMFNRCFADGVFPECFKSGVIKPVYKSGKRTEITNYRPITLLTAFSKILEKLLKKRMDSFIEKHNIISKKQYGFVQNSSTEDAIRDLTQHIYERLDKGLPLISLFLDLSKAFDTVSHEKLLEKLYSYGFRGTMHKLLTSYLTRRKQMVQIGSEISSERETTYGVPQGTVLGPLLFIIYINDLLKMKNCGNIISYADDTVILYEADTWAELKLKIEREFLNIKHWLEANTLTLNMQKSFYLPFSSYESGLPNLGPINIHQTNLRISEAKDGCMKYLGIIIDRHMRWDCQCQYVAKKLRGLMYKFKYLQRLIDVRHLKMVYFALAQSQITYGNVGWGASFDSHIEQVNIAQKRLIKIIHNKRITYPTHELFEMSGIMDVKQLYCLKISEQVQQGKIQLSTLEHEYGTRQKLGGYKLPRAERRIGQRSSRYLAPRIYQHIPKTITKMRNPKRFRTHLRRWICEEGRDRFHDLINNRL